MLFFDIKIKKFKKRENSGKNKQKHLNLQKYEKKFKIFKTKKTFVGICWEFLDISWNFNEISIVPTGKSIEWTVRIWKFVDNFFICNG